MPSIGASIATPACTSARTSPVWIGMLYGSAGGSPGSYAPSISSPQTFSNGTRPTSSSMSTPR